MAKPIPSTPRLNKKESIKFIKEMQNVDEAKEPMSDIDKWIIKNVKKFDDI